MGGQPWRVVPAALTLRRQVDERWPHRDRGADGTVGDTAHQARPSDHNPDARGWVHALDIDKDGIDADALADQLIALARSGRDRRIKNVVWAGKVASGTYVDRLWTWRHRPDLGHYDHIHVSFTKYAETDGSEFPLPIFDKPKPPAPQPIPEPEDPDMVIVRNASTKELSLVSGSLVTRIEQRSADNLKAAGLKVVDITAADYARLTLEGA